VDPKGKATINGNRSFGRNNGNGNGRKLFTNVQKTILAVRVTASDGTTNTFSKARLSESVFGSPNDNFNLIKGYNTCSNDQFFLKKADDRDGISTSIANGVVQVTLTDPLAIPGQDADGYMRNAITTELNAQFEVGIPTALADHVMMCLPPGTLDGLAYAFINSWMSVYNDIWCTKPSAQIHELGHNFDLCQS
jgi:hypothetical protein